MVKGQLHGMHSGGGSPYIDAYIDDAYKWLHLNATMVFSILPFGNMWQFRRSNIHKERSYPYTMLDCYPARPTPPQPRRTRIFVSDVDCRPSGYRRG